MRHRKNYRKLNRKKSHYKMMFRNMIVSLINYEIISTTLQKAKELKKIIEPIISFAKVNNLSNKRLIYNKIKNKSVVTKLFHNIALRFYNRKGGYIRIIKCGFRVGDNAKMAYICFLDKI